MIHVLRIAYMYLRQFIFLFAYQLLLRLICSCLRIFSIQSVRVRYYDGSA